MSNIIKNTLGQRFQKYRIEKGLSQAELAEGICSPATVSHLETDRSISSAKILGKLAEKLDIHLKELMDSEESELDIKEQLSIIKVYIASNDTQRAMEIILDLKRREDLLEHQIRELKVFESHCLTLNGNPSRAADILQPLIEELEIQKSGEDTLLCELYNRLGIAFYKLRDFSKAFSAYHRGYQISLRFPSFDALAAKIAKNLGLTCNQLGMTSEAQLYLEKSYNYYHSISDIRSLADSVFSLGIATGSSEYLEQALSLYESLNAVREAFFVRQHYAISLEANRDYLKAVSQLFDLAEQLDQINETGTSLFALSSAVIIAIDHADVDEALRLLKFATSYKLEKGIENPYDVALFYRATAKMKLVQGEFNDCLNNSMLSKNMYDMMGLYLDSADSLEIAIQALQKQGLYKDAFEYSQQMNQYLRRARGKLS